MEDRPTDWDAGPPGAPPEPPPAPRELAVRVQNLVKDYGETRAVDHLSFGVPTGEFFGFLGPNGAGKSTTIRVLCGLLRPTAGTVEVAGADVLADPVLVKSRIGVLPEDPVLYERLSGREMLWYAGRLYGLDGPTIARRTTDLLELMALPDVDANKAIVDYSMGMRKKIGLACALLHGPRVLFLDEPFNGIDAVTSRSIYRLLQSAVAGGMTVFFSSHVLEVAESLCTSVGIIDDGVLRAFGTLDEVRAQAGASPDTPLGDVFVDLVDPDTQERGGELLEWLA